MLIKGWHCSIDFPLTVCAARGLVAFARCEAMHRMRCNALRCTGCDARADVLRVGCDAMRCAALHGARIVCDAMRCARAGCIRAVRGLFAMQYAARGLVAFARCSRRHTFDGGIFRVGFFGIG
jgi:hypothetical protein